jgi:hypothetical protein
MKLWVPSWFSCGRRADVALLGEGRKAEVRKALEKADDPLKRKKSPAVRLDVQLIGARLDSAAGQTARALQSLEAVAAEASRYGYLGLHLEVASRLGDVEMAAGRADAEATAPP